MKKEKENQTNILRSCNEKIPGKTIITPMKNKTYYQISNRPKPKKIKNGPIKTYKDQTPDNQIAEIERS